MDQMQFLWIYTINPTDDFKQNFKYILYIMKYLCLHWDAQFNIHLWQFILKVILLPNIHVEFNLRLM